MFDPDPAEMRRIGYATVDRIVDHFGRLGEMRVASHPDAAELRALLDEPLPRAGLGLDDSLRRFFEEILPHATLVNHPRFFAYIPGPGSFAGAIGEFCAAATNLFVGTWLGGASMAQLEVQTITWLRSALGLDAAFDGVLTSGGSIANLSGLAAARNRARRRGVDDSRARVYASSEAHYSMSKAATLLGFAAAQCVTLPVDSRQQLDCDALRSAVRADLAAGHVPIFLCASAGTTSTGATDPIDDCAEICGAHDIWLHVDGAYGAAFALLPESVTLRRQLARADSITLDPHKWLYAPFECGTFLTRHLDDLHEAFGGDGAYMQDVPKDEVNFFRRGPELSRGNRALELWMLLRSVGVDAIADRIREDCRLAQVACEMLAQDPRIRIVTQVSMSVFTFALVSGAAAGRALVHDLITDGTTMLSSSLVDGEFVLRFCVANHRTSERDIHLAVQQILA